MNRVPPEPAVILILAMASNFAERLAFLRKARNLTQQQLADLTGISVIQIHRYESASSQPTLEAIRKLSQTLGVSADELIFGKDQRGPDEDLRLQFEALAQFSPEEKKVAKAVLDSLILQHQARRWASG